MTNNTDSNNPAPAGEPSAVETGASYIAKVMELANGEEARRIALWRQIAEEKTKTIITRGNERGHLRTVIRARGKPVGEN